MAPLGDQIKEEVEAWNLYLRLGYAEGEPVEPQEWLEARLEALGVEHGEDIGLLEAGDLAFEGIPELERPRFDRHYPRALRLENLDVVVHYEPRHKRVTVERTGGTRRSPPARRELPAWKGWSIRYRDGSREVPIS